MNKLTSKISNAPVVIVVLFGFALLLSASFYTRIFLPKFFLILFFWVLFTCSFVYWVRDVGLSILPRFFLACFGMSFLVFFEYLFADYSDFARGLPLVDALASQPEMVEFVLTCGNLGLIGLVMGFLVIGFGSSQNPTRSIEMPTASGLGYVLFCYIIPFVGVAFLFISQPKATILTMSYSEITSGESRALVEGVAFDGLGYIMYIWLAAAWIATEKGREMDNWKVGARRYLIGLLLFLLVFSNLLKGSRTIAGLIAAISMLYVTEGVGATGLFIKASIVARIRRILPWTILTFVVFMVWGEVRAGYVEGRVDWNTAYLRLTNVYKSGEWIAGIYASFGMAEEFFSGSLRFLYGETYKDYFLSLPPGPIASLFQYERPINSAQGPSYWYIGYTVGGMNPIIVPFKNFGPVGIVVHMALCGIGIGWAELLVARREPFGRLLLAGLFVGGFHWFWYGDMYIVRVLMIVAIVGVCYRIMIGPLRLGGRGMLVGSSPRSRPALRH